MIGRALSHKEQEKVVSNLATLDAPWNCPHGRPTMRFLEDLSKLPKASREHRRPIKLLAKEELAVLPDPK